MRMTLALLATAMAAAPALAADPVTIKVAMTGAAEVPAGDPDGTGTASVTIDAAKGQVCYTLSVAGIDTATMAHIHKGAAGVAGPVVVPLDPPATGSSTGCKPVDPAVIAAILATPSDYYVNIHNAAFPKGALRGQLGG
ncbi:CHRD domain-containing protein [Sphingomonas oligophenolica]|uniref:CHRD domain-containing protein n=1 Tax=Sphingomonas oligophenolica TaxID=301154 RepID=A0ABU9Y2Q2_9SPHN